MGQKVKRSPDKILLYLLTALLVVGLLALLSASIDQSQQDFGNVYGYFMHQLLYGFLAGGIAAAIMYKFPYQKVQKIAPAVFILSVLIMMLVFIPGMSVKSGMAQRWIEVGPFTFQPSELVKFTFILYLGSWLGVRVKGSKNALSLAPFLVFLGGLAVLLLLQPNFSTFGIIALTAGTMYFVAGGPLRHMAYMGSLGIAAFFIFIKIAPYRMERILVLLDPDKDPLGMGYQINQALVAIGAGKIWGFGPLQGIQKLHIPLAMNDSIFAVWAEETGFIGASVLLLLYLALAWRGLWLTERIKDHFAKIVMAGITIWIFLQAIVNIGSTIGIMPLTGITLPLVSYGASSLVVTLAALGFMLQLSKQAEQ
ncbi:MAG: putative peptidoglycan glycosyltransferase FtsW [Candidatus Spechtbacteria bacterium]|nr:putative peptidoglycan glycosyltransferase FtsW [Candidatus Spechtbacteria bacterium]